LIILGFIGFLAVFLIPQIIQNVSKNIFTTDSETFLLILNQTINKTIKNNQFSNYPSNDSFADVFQQYLKIDLRCDNKNLDKCFIDKFKKLDGTEIYLNSLKTSKDLRRFKNFSPLIGFTLTDGKAIIMTYNPFCLLNSADEVDNYSPKTYCLSMLYDINGYKPPNVLGRDILTLNASLTDCDGLNIDGLCTAAGETTATYINTCLSSNDSIDSKGKSNLYCRKNYWAGADLACKAQGMRLPSAEELNKIYENKDSLTGFNSFYWTSSEVDSSNVLIQDFSSGNMGSHPKKSSAGILCVK
jgi:hypothetical protein